MEWMRVIEEAINYTEEHLTDDITVEMTAEHVHLSPFYFHKGFSMLCGYSYMEYVRNRRMSLAGGELITSDISVMDLAMKYGYDSPDSFTKAFSRFHGASPLAVRRDKTMVKIFAPLQLTISLKGGYLMDYTITKKNPSRFWQRQKHSAMSMQSRKFPLSGRSTMPLERENMSAVCLESTLTFR